MGNGKWSRSLTRCKYFLSVVLRSGLEINGNNQDNSKLLVRIYDLKVCPKILECEQLN